MARIVADRVLETSSSTGIGAITLAGAIDGYKAYSDVHAIGDTSTYYIEAVDGGTPTGDWETGLGTFGAANTLARTAVYASSNSNALVDFTSGTKRVALALSATASLGNTTVTSLTTEGKVGVATTPYAWGGVVPYSIDINSSSIASNSSNTVTYISANTYYNGTNWLAKTTAASHCFRLDALSLNYQTAVSATAGTAVSLLSKFYVDGTNGNVTVYGTLTETSSIKLKENVVPISNALESVKKLVGVTYDRKDGSSINEAGLIAEEVNKVLPNVVTKDDSGDPIGINYTKLSAYLIEAIKTLSAEIDLLKAK